MSWLISFLTNHPEYSVEFQTGKGEGSFWVVVGRDGYSAATRFSPAVFADESENDAYGMVDELRNEIEVEHFLE